MDERLKKLKCRERIERSEMQGSEMKAERERESMLTYIQSEYVNIYRVIMLTHIEIC